MPIDQKTRHHRHEARIARRRARPARATRQSRMGPAFEEGAKNTENFYDNLIKDVKVATAAERAERLARQDRRELAGWEPPEPLSHMPATTIGSQECDPRVAEPSKRAERRHWLRVYRRATWPRRLQVQDVRAVDERSGRPIIRRRYPVPRRKLISLRMAREVAEANVGVRQMHREAEEQAAEARQSVPKRLRARLAGFLRRRGEQEGPTATPEAAAAVERLYGTREAEKIAQALGQRAMAKQDRRRGLTKRFFRRGKV